MKEHLNFNLLKIGLLAAFLLFRDVVGVGCGGDGDGCDDCGGDGRGSRLFRNA